MHCPSCHATLRTIDYEGIKIETCPSCRGEWLDAGELTQITKVREVRFDEQERRALATAAMVTGVRIDRVDRGLACPRCGGRTEAVNYGGDSGIIIDRCPSCRGIWLDQGELERIQMVVEGWADNLPDHLAEHGARMRKVTAEVDAGDTVTVSRFSFVNSIVNGVLDVFT